MTTFDIITITVLFVFLTIGFFKGGIGTVLSAFKWYGAGVIAVIAYPHTKIYAEEYLGDSAIANGVTIFALYIVALIALVIISMAISSALKSVIGGAVDRFIGLILGITIGFIIISSAHFIIDNILKGEPDWLKDGKTFDLTKFGSDIIGKFASGDFTEMVEDFGIKVPNSSKNNNNEVTKQQLEEAEQAVKETESPEDYRDLNIEKIRGALEELKSEGLSKEEAKERIQEMIDNNERDFRSFEQELETDYRALPE